MGRTVPTYRMVIERIAAGLSPFRRALREEDRLAFDRLMNRIRERASAAGFLVEESPLESALLAALVGQEREIQRLREELTALRGTPTHPGVPPIMVPSDGEEATGEGEAGRPDAQQGTHRGILMDGVQRGEIGEGARKGYRYP